MIVRRRTRVYRLAKRSFAEMICVDQPVAASKAGDIPRRSVGIPVDLWGRNNTDVLPQPK